MKKDIVKKDEEAEEVEETEETEDEDLEEETSEDEAEDEELEAESEEDTEAEVEKIADAIKSRVVKEMRLSTKDLQGKIDKMIGRGSNLGREYSLASKIYGPEGVKAGVETLTKEEKIVGFFQALLNRDHLALKALSEGVAADENRPAYV